MKPVTYCLVGVLIGALAQWLCLPHPGGYRVGRYQVQAHDGYMVKVDTATGRTWMDSTNGWVEFQNVSTDVSTPEKVGK